MKIGIVGCGMNADYHLRFVRAYLGATVVGMVDNNEVVAKAFAARHEIPNVFGCIEDLVKTAQPDAVHIVTPPGTHASLAQEAIMLGCHTLVEKPFALDLSEANHLFELAEHNGVNLCAMHNHFFDPCMLKARRLIENGAAGPIISLDSHYGLNTHIDAFRKYPSPNQIPWLYNLPAGQFHDFLPHPLYVMLPYLGKIQEFDVQEKSFGDLPQDLSDELHVLIRGDKAIGHATISFAAKPHQHYLRIFGTRMMIHVDFNTMTTTVHPVSSLPKAAQRAMANIGASWQLASSTVENVWNFARKRLRPYQGMQTLIHQFYDAIQGKGEMPVSREDALSVMAAIDGIVSRLKGPRLNFEPIGAQKYNGTLRPAAPRVLVTGATGFFGKRLIEILTSRGYAVRALARKLANVNPLQDLGVEIYFGDVAARDSLLPAFEGIDLVVHAAADTAGSEEEGQISTIDGTRNVLDLCAQFPIKKLIYISSCSVYHVAGMRRGDTITETSPLEPWPRKRGAYSWAKWEAEKLVRSAMEAGRVPIICLRPGTIFGPGTELYTPMMGFSVGRKLFLTIGNGQFELPLVYIDNLVDAILLAMENGAVKSGIFNVVDPEKVTKKAYIEGCLKKIYPKALFLYFPSPLLYGLCYLQQGIFHLMKRKPFLTAYRLRSSQKNVSYDGTRLSTEFRWQPRVSVSEAFDKVIHHESITHCLR